MNIFLIVSAVALITGGAPLVVNQPQAQPKLEVKQSRSTVWEDGSVTLQNANYNPQQTVRHSDLQGN